QHADTVIIGESEELWPKFIKDFSSGRVEQFYGPSRLVDMTKLPLPRYDLLNRKNYSVAWVQATRGCPIDCEFCAASKVYGLKFRHKDVEQVIEEIKHIIKLWGRGVLISFADDNMFVDKKYAIRLVEKLIPLKIKWFAQTDVSIARDEKFLILLRKSGCSVLFIGFETLNETSLSSLDRNNWKVKQLKYYKDAIKKIQSYGMGIFGAFMLGLDGDTPSTFKNLINFINDTNLYATQITILTPLPGTRLRDRLEKEGRLLPSEWNDFTFLKANYLPKHISIGELEDGLFTVYSEIYSKESIIARAKYFKKVYSELIR
ncbi:MAG: B12-binding domain-containing radical SAM protein, partial [Candidatus Omnitrophica bacterium]|nr:B12-binding domain-containing radical SAM protein [Candidatus Omnitrophota bacterium]